MSINLVCRLYFLQDKTGVHIDTLKRKNWVYHPPEHTTMEYVNTQLWNIYLFYTQPFLASCLRDFNQLGLD